MHNPRAHRPAFTLIELLVVIAIVGVLVGVLLPSLSGARTSARRSVTLARLHDLGLGMTAYSLEYKDKLPTLEDREEKAFLGISLLAKWASMPAQALINPTGTDTPASALTGDDRPVLVDLNGIAVDSSETITSAQLPSARFHCSFSFDNDKQLDKAYRPVVYMGDRPDYFSGATFSPYWRGAGICTLSTDQSAGFVKWRSLRTQRDPNMYRHNEFGGEGSDEVVDGISVGSDTLDTHLRFFSEDEDDGLLPN